MKETGARIVARTPTLAMYFSTSYLLSKCGMPVCRLAEPTEVKTRCTPAAFAAAAAATPCRVSASVPPNGVVIAKREVAPSSAFVIAAVSSSDAALFTRGARDDDGKLLRHVLVPFSCGHDLSDVSSACAT